MEILIIAIVLAVFFLVVLGFFRFHTTVEKEKNLFFNEYGKTEKKINTTDIAHLPSKMKAYMEKTGVLGKCKDCHVTFRQSGKIKTRPNKKWMHFTATQYMRASHPGFIWSARSYPMFIRDKSVNGKGEVMVSLFGLKTVSLSADHKTDVSALARCLGELLFYPIGFLSETISFEVVGKNALKASIEEDGTKASGIFYFNKEGLIDRFTAQRYRGEKKENFTGMALNYKMMGGFYLPSKMKAIWNLKEGDFEYFNSEIVHYSIA